MKKLWLVLCLFSVLAIGQVNNSPNMNLPIPVPGQTAGPQWAQDINASLTLIDQHNHTPGNGVPIPPAGLNINTALSFQGNSATSLQASVYVPQMTYSTNYGVHVEGVDLYYVDGNGNDIQMTSGGTVNATSSGISSGTASASFAGSPAVLVVNAASSTPANIQGGSILLGNNAANSKFLTLSPPNSMPSNIGEVLPAIPANQSFMTIDSSGNMAAYANISQGITRSNLAAVGQQISSSSGTFSTSSTSFTAITNLSVTITTSGRPVILLLNPSNTGTILNASSISVVGNAASHQGWLQMNKNSSALFSVSIGITPPTSLQVNFTGGLLGMDTPSAGTYTYSLSGAVQNGTDTLYVTRYTLVAYEL